VRCLWASLLFGAAGAISPALQSVGVTQGYYLFSVAPYVLTLALMIASCSLERSMRGAPDELEDDRADDPVAKVWRSPSVGPMELQRVLPVLAARRQT
jgi:hypothetical protein